MVDTLIILAGGLSSRMRKSAAGGNLDAKDLEQANYTSKGLISVGVGDGPLLDYLLYNAHSAGIENVVIVTGPNNAAFRDYYGAADADNLFHGLKISYAIQSIPAGREKPLGTVDALVQALVQYPELRGEAFLVCNSDNLYSQAAFSKLQKTDSPNAWIAYDRDGLKFPTERISGFAITTVNDRGELTGIIEKPTAEEVEASRGADGCVRVSMNVFKMDGGMIFPYLENCPVHPVRREQEIPTALLNMVGDKPGSMVGIPMKEHVPDLTEKKDIATVRAYLADQGGKPDW